MILSLVFVMSSNDLFEFSIVFISVPISGIIKNLGSSLALVIVSIPFSVSWILLLFSSIVKYRGSSASGINFELSCK